MANQTTPDTTRQALGLLKSLIKTPSLSKQEAGSAAVIAAFLKEKGVAFSQKGHNIWALNTHFDPGKPTILLNSHHDTVKPNQGYTLDPFTPIIDGDKLYGLGSNDAGGPLASLIMVFVGLCQTAGMAYNLVMAATAEEEISGKGGVESILPDLPPLDFAIVGEPTQMHMAVAEKGLMVLDCTAEGKSGHAARQEGVNAIYRAIDDIAWFQSFRFDKESALLGPVHMNVTQISAGSQHNVVPDRCQYVVDVRTTDAYSNEEVLDIVRQHVASKVEARSTRLQPSFIDAGHPVVQAGLALGRKTYGSPTLSDQALLHVPSVKIGPGDSGRSHTADEFIHITEISEGIALYEQLLAKLLFNP